MTLRLFPLAVLAAAVPGAALAENWEQVSELPGGIALELDRDTVFEELDGIRMVLRGTFRKQMPNVLMETAVAVDCRRKEAKIRGVRLSSDGKVLSENVLATSEFAPIGPGSGEALYYKALCGEEIAIPDAPPESEAPPADAAPKAGDGGETGE